MSNAHEVTRVRKGGRKVTVTADPLAVLQALRDCVKSQSFIKINGCAVDTFSASAVVAVHDRLNPDNQAKLLRMSVPGMVTAAFKLLNK